MRQQLKEIFALEQREIKTRGRYGQWHTTSLYSPFDRLGHDYEWCAKKADSGEGMPGVNAGKRYRRFEYRVVRFHRSRQGTETRLAELLSAAKAAKRHIEITANAFAPTDTSKMPVIKHLSFAIKSAEKPSKPSKRKGVVQ